MGLIFSFQIKLVTCSKADLMDDTTPVTSKITVSSNPKSDIDDILSGEPDSKNWQPDEDDTNPEITITITEEEKPITDVVISGEFENFVVIIYNDENEIVAEEASDMTMRRNVCFCQY